MSATPLVDNTDTCEAACQAVVPCTVATQAADCPFSWKAPFAQETCTLDTDADTVPDTCSTTCCALGDRGGIEVEAYVTNITGATIQVRGGQIDIPCSLLAKPGATGSVDVNPVALHGGTTDPDGDGQKGPSRSNVPYLFGAAGLGPYAPATCIIANTPAPGGTAFVNMPNNQKRYVGTFIIDASDCAVGGFNTFFECTDVGGPNTQCDNMPEATNTTRYRDNTGGGMGLLISLTTVGKTQTIEGGTCCDGVICECDNVNAYCCATPGAQGRPAECDAGDTFNGGATCFLDPPANTVPNPVACACTDAASCNDNNACTTDACNVVTGQCSNTLISCEDNNVCTDDSCNPASGCVNANNTANCSIGGEGSPGCDNQDTCLNGACQENLKPMNTPCGSPASGECDAADTCNAAGQCQTNNIGGPCADDGNPCTSDTCGGGTCNHTAVAAGTSCIDGLKCTLGDTCSAAGVCSGTPNTCNDNNPCTGDSCSEAAPGNGCVNIDVSTVACLDNDVCDAIVEGAVCVAGFCACNPCIGFANTYGPCQFTSDCPAELCSVDNSACTPAEAAAGPCVRGGTTGVCNAGALECRGFIPGQQQGGCVRTCSDGDACTTNDVCYANDCVGGNPLCPSDGDLCTTDCTDGECVITPIPGADCEPTITFEPKDGGDNDCFSVGDDVVVNVVLGGTTLCVAGGEFRLEYDPTCLDFVSVVGTGIWTNEIYVNVNESTGVIVFAVGVAIPVPPGGPKCLSAGAMAEITFEKVGKCNTCTICPEDLNPAHNRLTSEKGDLIEFDLNCGDPIHDDRPETFNCPFQNEEGGIAVNSDCLSTTASLTWPPVTGSNQCDGAFDLDCECTYSPIRHCRGPGNKVGVDDDCQKAAEGAACSFCLGNLANEDPGDDLCYDGTCEDKWDASEVDCMDYVNAGGDMPQGTYRFDCSSEKSLDNVCADGSTCAWTVQVSDHQSINAHVQLSPVVVNNQFDRCICFELISSCFPEVIEETCHTMHFGGPGQFAGQSTEGVKVKKGKYVSITARDRQHSLRATDLSLLCDNGVYIADFSGDPFFGGNWLVQGNLNRDAIIDILDFGVFLGQLNQNPNPKQDKLCEDNNGKGFTHADLNGDGNVDVADFTFIQINFLEDDKDSACPDSAAAAPVVGLTEISVKDLRTMGLGELAVADLNNDGMVNTEDMAAYLSGARPKDAGKGTRGNNGRVGSLRK